MLFNKFVSVQSSHDAGQDPFISRPELASVVQAIDAVLLVGQIHHDTFTKDLRVVELFYYDSARKSRVIRNNTATGAVEFALKELANDPQNVRCVRLYRDGLSYADPTKAARITIRRVAVY